MDFFQHSTWINDKWNEECIPLTSEEPLIVPIFNKGLDTDCISHRGTKVYSYQCFSISKAVPSNIDSRHQRPQTAGRIFPRSSLHRVHFYRSPATRNMLQTHTSSLNSLDLPSLQLPPPNSVMQCSSSERYVKEGHDSAANIAFTYFKTRSEL